MENVVHLFEDEHRRVSFLLPWYVTGRLDTDEHSLVDAHLGQCADCQAELAAERILKAEVSGLSIGTDANWAMLQERIAAAPRRRRAGPMEAMSTWLGDVAEGWSRADGWIRWGLVAQSCALVAVTVLALMQIPLPGKVQHTDSPAYTALGSAPTVDVANVAVMFRPDTTEGQLRRTLNRIDARVVDGPTAANVYLLHVPAGQRSLAVQTLHSRPEITLAEPIDGEETR